MKNLVTAALIAVTALSVAGPAAARKVKTSTAEKYVLASQAIAKQGCQLIDIDHADTKIEFNSAFEGAESKHHWDTEVRCTYHGIENENGNTVSKTVIFKNKYVGVASLFDLTKPSKNDYVRGWTDGKLDFERTPIGDEYRAITGINDPSY